MNYTQFYNFQSIRKKVDTITNQAIVDSINSGGFSHSINASASLTTTLYSYYKFIGKRNTLLRHVLTPTISFNYTPAIQTSILSYSDTLGKIIEYSPFERSIYQESLTKSSGRIAFGVNNSFELKQKSEKDTVTGFKKTRLIDNFLLNTDYDIFKDSMNWSDLNIRLVINPIQTFSVTINAIHSWYSWNETTGEQLSTYAVKNGQGLGRIRTSSVATSWVITTKKNREMVQQQQIEMAKIWNPQ